MKLLLKTFLSKRLLSYAKNRHRPDKEGTSLLSPYLAFGEISPRKIWHALPEKAETLPYKRQLLWREFAYSILYHIPETRDQNMNARFNTFPWKKERALQAYHSIQRTPTRQSP